VFRAINLKNINNTINCSRNNSNRSNNTMRINSININNSTRSNNNEKALPVTTDSITRTTKTSTSTSTTSTPTTTHQKSGLSSAEQSKDSWPVWDQFHNQFLWHLSKKARSVFQYFHLLNDLAFWKMMPEKQISWNLMTSPAVTDLGQCAFPTCASGSQKSIRRCRRWTTF